MVTDEQLAGYLSGTLSPEEKAALESELLQNEAARRALLAQQQISAGLRALYGKDHDRLAQAILTTTRGMRHEALQNRVIQIAARAPKRQPAWRTWPFAAVAAAVLFLCSIWLIHVGTRRSNGLATLSHAVGAGWADGPRKTGQRLGPDWLRLKSGAVQIDFSRGARVVLEGPAEFRLVSDNEGFLQRGKLRAFVPEPAHGFTIRGGGFTVIDHGTEFGIIAAAEPEVHVFAGTVAVRGESERVLAKGEAVRLSPTAMEVVALRPELFINEGALMAMEASAALSAHPAAVAHYDFDNDRVLKNLVRGQDIPASVLGCTAAAGRWPGHGALEFKRAVDRVRLTVPGEIQSLTLLAWVRVDGLPNTQSSLLMGGSEQPGEVHWFLHRYGAAGFAIIGRDNLWHGLQTPMLLHEPDLGRWNFFAVTFDGAAKVATHYFNGKPVASQPLDPGGPLRLGTVELGNWELRPGVAPRASKRIVAEPGGHIRNLDGCMDEFAILSAPLSAREIQRLYETGRPGPSLTFSK